MAHLLQLVKAWAKARNFNDPVDGTFNTYALCLMVRPAWLSLAQTSPVLPAVDLLSPAQSWTQILPCRESSNDSKHPMIHRSEEQAAHLTIGRPQVPAWAVQS